MRDIWSFLLQTLTASSAAVLLLVIKRMFRDKLPPRWQFASWGILALVLLVPAGLDERYTLVNWPLFVEALKSAVTGDYSTLTHVTAPVPLPPQGLPASFCEWLFVLYAAGVVFFLVRYMLAYIRLRIILRRGRPADCPRLQETATRYCLPICRAVEVPGLPSAFVCGVLRPVLALPAGAEVDEKVLLHELLHLKYHDISWGIIICIFRCIHWCNPLIWYCAGQAGNDLEALCDQRVLERLEGEERRDYGRILLAMADAQYAHAPGTSSMANGGENIRRRIEAIVRFKKYPKGMALVSVCIVLLLAEPLLIGRNARALTNGYSRMASARTVWCTTYAGAFDAYAKAVLNQNLLYRAMCAPLSEQNELAALYQSSPRWTWEQMGLSVPLYINSGYKIYNLIQVEAGAYEGVLVADLGEVPEGKTWDGRPSTRWLAVQPLHAEKEGGRWVVRPLEEIHEIPGDERSCGNLGLPAWEYSAQAEDFTVLVRLQSRSSVDSYITNSNGLFSTTIFDQTPHPDANLGETYLGTTVLAFYTGTQENKGNYHQIKVLCQALGDGQERGKIGSPSHYFKFDLDQYWDGESPILLLGTGDLREAAAALDLPASYAADLYLNDSLAAELTLLPVEGDGRIGES